ncbi:MAG: DUF4199 domain-containing protein [Saprospiraceae bacterium]|nr:DUF4199 domain-containing protein [Saprospiraceae bacterium]
MNNLVLKYGLLGGLATVAYYLLFYFIDQRWMLSPWVAWSAMLFYPVAMVLALRQDRSQSDGPYAFKQGLRTGFAVYVIADVIYYAFYFVLFKYVDPGLVDVQQEMFLESLENNPNLFGETNVENLRRQFQQSEYKLTVGSVLQSLGLGLIGGFLIAAILAYWHREDK